MRLFIASPDKQLRMALLLFLDDKPGMVVIGMADRMQGLLAQVESSQPDVLLMDYKLDVQRMQELVIALHNLEHQPKTILLSTRAHEKEAIMAGADYFIRRDAPPDKLLHLLNDIQFSQTKKSNS